MCVFLRAGTMAAKAHPNMLLWNVTRFHPFYALVEARTGLLIRADLGGKLMKIWYRTEDAILGRQ